MNTYSTNQAIELGTLVTLIGREARGEKVFEAMLGVGWSVRNRVENPRWWGHDWLSVMGHPEAYSSMNPPTRDNDPNLRVYPDLHAPAWILVIEAAEASYWATQADPTHGATHYFDRSIDDDPPIWSKARGSEHLCDIGDLHFWRCS